MTLETGAENFRSAPCIEHCIALHDRMARTGPAWSYRSAGGWTRSAIFDGLSPQLEGNVHLNGPEDEGTGIIRHVGNYLQVDTAYYSRRLIPSAAPLWAPQALHS